MHGYTVLDISTLDYFGLHIFTLGYTWLQCVIYGAVNYKWLQWVTYGDSVLYMVALGYMCIHGVTYS